MKSRLKRNIAFTIVFIIFACLFYLIYKHPKLPTKQTAVIFPTHPPAGGPTAIAKKSNSTYAPYMIQTLQNRIFEKSQIQIGDKAYETNLFTAYKASYMSDNLRINALISVPKNNKQTNPILVFLHGYIEPDQYSTISSYKKPFDYYASHGYVVVKPDYRANGNSEGDKNNPYNRLSYAIDVLNLIPSLDSIEHADTKNIFLWGHSLGGDVALRVLESNKSINAASLWAPVSADFPESMLYYVRRHRPQDLDEIKRILKSLVSQKDLDALSPSKNTAYIKTPIIIHQGTADTDVPIEWNNIVDARLTKNNVDHVYYTYNGEDHNFNGGSKVTILKRDIDFFSKYSN